MINDTSLSPRRRRGNPGNHRTILWWGRSDPEYARNRTLRRSLKDAGLRILDFRPRVAATGDLEASLRIRSRVDLVWVPCFRQRDLAAARRWTARRGIPLIFDPLISAYDKQVFERGKLVEHERRAGRLLDWEKRLFSCVDVLLADTQAHATFFRDVLDVPEALIHVVPLCADEDLFTPQHKGSTTPGKPEALFFGSFIPLQGPDVIVEAANRYRGPTIRWCLVGNGPMRAACRRLAADHSCITFEDWIPYETLAARIGRADLVLGIFGCTPKAGRVVPNKLCQALACARPVVTRSSPAYSRELLRAEQSGITWVPPGDAEALSDAVAELAASPGELEARGQNAFVTYQRSFSSTRVSEAVVAAVAKALSGAAAQ